MGGALVVRDIVGLLDEAAAKASVENKLLAYEEERHG